MRTQFDSQAASAYLPAACWAFALAIAGFQTWVWRDWMSVDGVCYLDMADAIREGAWLDAVNGLWSPLYPFVLAVTLPVFSPHLISEFQAVHLVNFAIFESALPRAR